MLLNLFHNFIYQPILSVLVFIYNNLSFGDLGVAVILLTFFIRLILFPVFYKSAKDQALMQALTPHIKKIQLDHKDDKEKQAKEMLNLYRRHRLNPFSGFFLLLLQLPVFIALFKIFSKEISTSLFDSHSFLGLINLAEKSLILAVLAAFFMYFQGKLAILKLPKKTKDDPAALIGRTMVVVGPVLTLVILTNLPSAIGLYWLASTIFSIGQQLYINKKVSLNFKFKELDE